MLSTYFQVDFYCVGQSQTEGRIGTLRVYGYFVHCDIYGLLIHKSHTKGVTNGALASGGVCYSASRVNTEKGVVAICSLSNPSHWSKSKN